MFSLFAAIVTSFMGPILSDKEGAGHYFSWAFLPIIFPILLIICIVTNKYDKIIKFINHLTNQQ